MTVGDEFSYKRCSQWLLLKLLAGWYQGAYPSVLNASKLAWGVFMERVVTIAVKGIRGKPQ